jgi:TRAP-type C4-dicarboxylate transport system permease small subunit
MQSGLVRLADGLGHLARAALWVAGAGLVAMTAIISAPVFFRYVLNDSIIWSEPAAVILMGWFIFLGAAVGIREGYHLSFDVLLYLLPERGKLVLYSISDLVVAAFGAGMMWYGGELMVAAYGITLPSLGVTGAIDFMPLVAGGALMVLFSLERLARRAAGLPTARFGETDPEEAL